MTYTEAETLLKMSKVIETNKTIILCLNKDIETRFKLISEINDQCTFTLTIWSGGKNKYKFTLHHQENNTNVCILRFDYNGTHQNPENVEVSVPKNIANYAGQLLHCSHVHIFVEGYKSGHWAIPLSDYENIDNINDDADFYTNFESVLRSFRTAINLKTPIFVSKEVPYLFNQ